MRSGEREVKSNIYLCQNMYRVFKNGICINADVFCISIPNLKTTITYVTLEGFDKGPSKFNVN